MKSCYLCQTEAVTEILDAGLQPIGNRFLTAAAAPENLYPMFIGQCQACGLIQTIDPVPAAELLPIFDWITYSEPEPHLDQMVEIIAGLPGITSQSKIGGVSFKDDSTLTRFEKLGFNDTWRIDPKEDLDITHPGAGVETIQVRLTPETAAVIAQKYGRADILIVRHILEHVHSAHHFIEALKALINPQGYIVFEVPDCARAIDHCDYTTLWEEHTLYFTPETFKNGLPACGLSLVHFENYPYPFENSLVGVVQPQPESVKVWPEAGLLEQEKRRAEIFARTLPEQKVKLKAFLADYSRNHGKIALFGAGHLACTYICIFEIRDSIAFVVDDNPHKRGLFMPGSRLPIRGSAALLEEEVKLCLLSLNPISEDKVIQNNPKFIDQGGEFRSIFPASPRALKV